MKYKIGERVELAPIPKGRGKTYSEMIEAVRAKGVTGAYPVEIEGMQPKQLYAALANKLKGKKDIRPRIRGEQVYLELSKSK